MTSFAQTAPMVAKNTLPPNRREARRLASAVAAVLCLVVFLTCMVFLPANTAFAKSSSTKAEPAQSATQKTPAADAPALPEHAWSDEALAGGLRLETTVDAVIPADGTEMSFVLYAQGDRSVDALYVWGHVFGGTVIGFYQGDFLTILASFLDALVLDGTMARQGALDAYNAVDAAVSTLAAETEGACVDLSFALANGTSYDVIVDVVREVEDDALLASWEIACFDGDRETFTATLELEAVRLDGGLLANAAVTVTPGQADEPLVVLYIDLESLEPLPDVFGDSDILFPSLVDAQTISGIIELFE